MSSQNTIVERASAELSKRINGLRKHSSSGSGNNSSSNNSHNSTAPTVNSNSIVGKTSVMERVTNVFCGGSSSNVHNNNNNNNNNNTNSNVSINNSPEKPYRYQNSKHPNNIFSQKSGGVVGGGSVMGTVTTTSIQISGSNSNQSTPQSLRKIHHHKTSTVTIKRLVPLTPHIQTVEQLFLDERFLQKFFLFFSPHERRDLAQVCTRWRDVLYRNPILFSGLMPVLQCRELRMSGSQDKVKLYNSIIRRGFHSLALNGATDEDALDIVHSFALASKHIHSLSVRNSSISDRGLEALLDHLQVSAHEANFRKVSSRLRLR